jgi:hypothetical protein
MVGKMLEKLEELLENDLLRNIFAGCSFSIVVVMLCIAIATGVAAIISSAWWAVAFVISTILAGGAIGLSIYLLECF